MALLVVVRVRGPYRPIFDPHEVHSAPLVQLDLEPLGSFVHKSRAEVVEVDLAVSAPRRKVVSQSVGGFNCV